MIPRQACECIKLSAMQPAQLTRQRMGRQVPRLVAWIFCSAIGAAIADSPLHLADCRLESALAGGSVAARCGWYRVRENRDDAQSKELQLHVAVVPALRLKPAADPLFILSGGPGQAASDFYLNVAPAFARIRRDRDLVLVDQRGTGRSNRLDCALPDDSAIIVLDPQKLQGLVQDMPRQVARRSALLHDQHRRPRSRRSARGARLSEAESLRHLIRHARRATLHAALSGARAHGDSRRRSPRGGRAWARRRDRSAAGDRQHVAALRAQMQGARASSRTFLRSSQRYSSSCASSR